MIAQLVYQNKFNILVCVYIWPGSFEPYVDPNPEYRFSVLMPIGENLSWVFPTKYMWDSNQSVQL